ncbi:CUGBP Elav-like family member 2-like isoform X5 [Anopheles sinensis]|uniref:CUGBP Elav-like family member 2-like isoform X5 n=1 Tax=Anopheles sinensis TaxID=74873 RepID=A0A084VPM9_ANOSI|nr:CUGBP Elav-like family member 2-like isoform X5 [Anopheles sinensis]
MKSRTKSPSSPSCGGVGGGGGGGAGVGPICPLRNEESSKSYPSISAAYWLPAPTPTPYQVPARL